MTAEEFLDFHPEINTWYDEVADESVVSRDNFEKAMIEFAKLKVKDALEKAGKIANEWENSGELAPEILNVYSLEDIK